MRPVSEDLKEYMRAICKLYGCKVKFTKEHGGSYWKGEIHVGRFNTVTDCINVFCHELGHYRNDIENKFPVYHHEEDTITIKRLGLQRYSTYALRAEIYTDKVGKELCKIWFPGIKYLTEYKNNAYWRGFMYGYYSN